ncbi:MAG: hypothetical protein IKM48_05230 [Clostridia bacterium]|nr:hypothetical protein [Clostridia bacterium]
MKKIVVWLMVLCLLTLTACKKIEHEATGESGIYIEDEETITENILTEDQAKTEENESSARDQSVMNSELTPEDVSTQEEEPVETEPSASEEEPLADTEIQTEEKEIIYVSAYYPDYSLEQVRDMADLIIKGKTKKKVSEKMVNPDGDLKDSYGNSVLNRLITEFEIEVLEIYKGTYDGETIGIKYTCGLSLSPEQILNGEDENVIVKPKVILPNMPMGEECILYLRYITDEGLPKWTDGYYPIGQQPGGAAGYLKDDGNGGFTNNVTTVTDESLKAELAALVKES